MLLRSILITETEEKKTLVSCGVINLHLMYISLHDDKDIFQSKIKLALSMGHKMSMLQLICF